MSERVPADDAAANSGSGEASRKAAPAPDAAREGASRRIRTGPLSEWDLRRSQEMLRANGFGDDPTEWRRAAGHPHGLVRAAATYLLTRNPDPADEQRLFRALDDMDESVTALAAYGLIRLGHEGARKALEGVANLDVDAFLGAALAAGLLAELGDPVAFRTIAKGISSPHGATRLWTLKNAWRFVDLHGQRDEAGEIIDIWKLYKAALQDRREAIRREARAQLEDLDREEARALLRP